MNYGTHNYKTGIQNKKIERVLEGDLQLMKKAGRSIQRPTGKLPAHIPEGHRQGGRTWRSSAESSPHAASRASR